MEEQEVGLMCTNYKCTSVFLATSWSKVTIFNMPSVRMDSGETDRAAGAAWELWVEVFTHFFNILFMCLFCYIFNWVIIKIHCNLCEHSHYPPHRSKPQTFHNHFSSLCYILSILYLGFGWRVTLRMSISSFKFFSVAQKFKHCTKCHWFPHIQLHQLLYV